MKDNCAFPETVEYKSFTATIYQQHHRQRQRFEVRRYDVAFRCPISRVIPQDILD